MQAADSTEQKTRNRAGEPSMGGNVADIPNYQTQSEPRAGVRGAPRVAIAEGLLEEITRYLNRFFHDGNHGREIGGALAGEFLQRHGAPLFRIREFIEAGPNADFSEDSVLFDTEYQSRTLALLRAQSPGITNIGCVHFHPDGMDVCSEGDWRADIEAVQASDTRALVFGIITIAEQSPGPSSLCCGNFKFNFFVLTEASGFQYLQVRPTIEPMLATSALACRLGLNTFARHRRHRAGRPKLLNDKRRLVAEVRAMEERYGGRATLRLERRSLFWDYTVTESGRRFPIRVCYPPDYPLHPPRIFSMIPLPPSPHQWPGNQLCWINQSGQCDWNPARDTAATCILAAHRWFACLLVYLTLGRWPEGADHEQGNVS